MTIISKLDQDMKEAMLAHESERLSVLRMLKNALKNAEIAKKEELTEGEILNVLDKQAKQRQDAIEQFTGGGRADLADKEKAELELIQSYLPEKMSESELEEVVVKTIEELGATSMADMGKVMKEVMAKTAGQADGKAVSEKVKQKLS
jgi:uncharacterized protein YqeY